MIFKHSWLSVKLLRLSFTNLLTNTHAHTSSKVGSAFQKLFNHQVKSESGSQAVGLDVSVVYDRDCNCCCCCCCRPEGLTDQEQADTNLSYTHQVLRECASKHHSAIEFWGSFCGAREKHVSGGNIVSSMLFYKITTNRNHGQRNQNKNPQCFGPNSYPVHCFDHSGLSQSEPERARPHLAFQESKDRKSLSL